MIIKEFFATRTDGVKLYRSYSDQKLQIQKLGTNEIYDEAVDVETSEFTYIETDIPVFVPEEFSEENIVE